MDKEAMAVRCPTAQFIGTAILPRHIFRINAQGVATVIWTGETHDYVYGVLWQIEPNDEASLDVFEGLGYAYSKNTVTIERKGGETERSMIYKAIDSRTGTPKEGYLDVVIAAAIDLQFPKIYLERLRQWQT